MNNTYRAIFAIFWVSISCLTGCQSIKKVNASRRLSQTFKESDVFNNQFTGFALYDPITGEYLKDINGDLYFTPASNTKILTTYACITTLGDSIPSFLYEKVNDTIRLSAFGDPTLLHTDFPRQPILHKIDNAVLEIHIPSTELASFGPGWAWDDYQYSFQSERSWVPIFGNEVRIFNDDQLHVVPNFFSNYINKYVGARPGSLVYRERKFNLFNIWMEYDTSAFERKIPFEWSEELTAHLLADTLHSSISIDKGDPEFTFPDTLYNQKTIPTIALMMQRSDNFLAEQLLVVSGRASGFSNMDAYRNYLTKKWELPAPIRWVDGSGLSRYNLITPKTFVTILDKIQRELSWNEIKWIFPNGGSSGTLRNWYPGDPTYLYAKTGTLSNNHCLSGYLITKSGKTLIFSFMNNHYLTATSDVKREMQKVLEMIRDNY